MNPRFQQVQDFTHMTYPRKRFLDSSTTNRKYHLILRGSWDMTVSVFCVCHHYEKARFCPEPAPRSYINHHPRPLCDSHASLVILARMPREISSEYVMNIE